MSKKYHLDQNNVAFLHCVNGAFAGVYTLIEMLKEQGKKVPKKKLLEALQETLAQTNTAISSEYIRGELIKKGVLDNDTSRGVLCLFDPSVDNENAETEVYTEEELKDIRLERAEPTWVNNVKGR
jgi:hypothetical protein